MRIEKEQLGALEDIIIWGIHPMYQLCRHMDEYISKELEDDEGVLWYHYEIRNNLERLEEALYNFTGSGKGKSRKQKAMEVMAQMDVKELDAIMLYADACVEKIRADMHMKDAEAE